MLDLTAILTARNAAGTLGALLDHLQAMGARVIVIDHGSDDETWSIADAHRGKPVAELIYEPFIGVFDLTRQLRLKQDIIQSLRSEWILHADADEFVEPPAGTTLAALLDRHAGTGVIAFASTEYMFLPATEEEYHDPTTFTRTMTRYVTFHERFPKQRLFRRGAPLDLWFRTGGHTLTEDPAQVAPEHLTLRHYLGLSLDDIRAQYLGRVFAARDRAKHWHGNRLASLRYDIVAPDPALLGDLRKGNLAPAQPVSEIPVFALRQEEPQVADPDGAAPDSAAIDFAIAGTDPVAVGRVAEALRANDPGLRIGVYGAGPDAARRLGRCPLLHVLRDPRDLPEAGEGKAELRRDASGWLRGVALIRQAAVMWAPPYAEVRIEDCDSDEAHLRGIVQALLEGRLPLPTLGFPCHASPELAGTVPELPAPLRRIAGGMMRQLGYL